ncbi:unnamed protein product [Ectocarpus fasciculatus]
MNILKYLQVQTVMKYEREYDDLYYELNKTGGLECLRSIAPVRSTDLLQPKVLDLQDCRGNEQLEKQLQFYLADAELAKPHLDELVTKVAHDTNNYEVQRAEVKSRASTRRKANGFCDGDVRKVADMARVTVICATPESLAAAYVAIVELSKQGILRVKNGFNSDWMPSGYRDVKLNPVLNEHLCEIQLHLREFFALKRGQHAVYEWARELNVTTEMRGEYLFKIQSPEVTKEMVRLAEENWRGSGYCLPDLQLAAGQYDLAEKSLQQEFRNAVDEARAFEDHDSKEFRRALRTVNTAGSRLAHVLQEQVRRKQLNQIQTQKNILLRTAHIIFTENRLLSALVTACHNKCDETEPHERSESIQGNVLAPAHPTTHSPLPSCRFSGCQGKYAEAEPLYRRSLAVDEKVCGPDHPQVAIDLTNLAGVLEAQGEYAEAKSLFERSQAIREKVLGLEHPDVATTLNNRAGVCVEPGPPSVCHTVQLPGGVVGCGFSVKTVSPKYIYLSFTVTFQGKYEEAEPLYVRSLVIFEKIYGPDHPVFALGLSNQAGLLESQGKYEEAEPLYVRSLAIREKSFGPDHPEVATVLINWAEFLRSQGRYEEAEPVYIRSLAIDEKVYGPDHPEVARGLDNWAGLLVAQGKYEEAEPLHVRSLAIRECVYGPDHPVIAIGLNNLAGLLESQGKYEDAEPLFVRSLAISEKVYGPDHPDVAISLNNRAALLSTQGKYDEAEPLYKRTQEIWEKSLGREHPNVATILNNRATLLQNQGKYAEAGPLYRRSLAMREEALGTDHPDVAHLIYNLALLANQQGKYKEAISLLEKALPIWTNKLGENHPHTLRARNTLEAVRKKVRAQVPSCRQAPCTTR